MKKKISKRVLIEAGVIVALAIIAKVGLMLITAHMGSGATNTTALPVQSGNVTVIMSHMDYHASVIAVQTGMKVTWINKDAVDHTVTEGKNAGATSNGFNSNILETEQSWSYVFASPGTYFYTCLFHANMNGEVIVKG